MPDWIPPATSITPLSPRRPGGHQAGSGASQRGRTRPPAPDPTTQQVDDLETFLDAQTRFLDSLASAYGALAGLATYDAAGKFNTAFAGLVTDTNGLLKTVEPKSAGLPTTATSVVQELGGDLMALRQRQQVIDASRAMRKPLQSAIDLLSRPDVRETFAANVDIYVSENRKALLDLSRMHLFTVAPLVDRMGTVIGQKSIPDLDRRVAGDRALNASLQQIADPRPALDKLKTDMTKNYDNALTALKALPPLHDKLEAGQPVDLTQLIAIVSQIKPIVQLAKGN